MKKDLSQLSDVVDSLNERMDSLLGKIRQAKSLLESLDEQFSKLPSLDDLEELNNAIPRAKDLEIFSEAWEQLPSIDELKEYSNEIPCDLNLESFEMAWANLPSIDEVRDYAEAASGIAAS